MSQVISRKAFRPLNCSQLEAGALSLRTFTRNFSYLYLIWRRLQGILLEQMDLSDDVLAKNHPASLQGRRLTLKVADIMCTDLSDCIVSDDIRCIDVVLVLNDFGGGFVVAIDGSKSLSGVFSDGDLRRAVKKYGHTALSMPIAQLMTLKPMTVGMNNWLFLLCKRWTVHHAYPSYLSLSQTAESVDSSHGIKF